MNLNIVSRSVGNTFHIVNSENRLTMSNLVSKVIKAIHNLSLTKAMSFSLAGSKQPRFRRRDLMEFLDKEASD
ncbi:hypothetical protein HYN46_02250 [Aquirhabdus parva]|uniref:Uncharacterized protein n=1 Tax=Aquirhabdus parva TaxID=2283318 RepID=A0A345P3E5_9GAMM|nr:hypothetical protein HYN46_02250 [Aquirhabdus parva]